MLSFLLYSPFCLLSHCTCSSPPSSPSSSVPPYFRGVLSLFPDQNLLCVAYERSFAAIRFSIDISHLSVSPVAACECNGRATSCSDGSGDCIGCTGNSKGEHCAKCVTGFFMNGTVCSRKSPFSRTMHFLFSLWITRIRPALCICPSICSHSPCLPHPIPSPLLSSVSLSIELSRLLGRGCLCHVHPHPV